jgi:hypothetical protein
MNLKGEYNGATSYEVGDVVRYTDGIAYILLQSCGAGTNPTNTLYWNRVGPPLQEVVDMIMSYGATIAAGVKAEVEAEIPQNISDEAITLKGSEDNEYLITVDDSGDTPELDVTLIEEETAEG